jgi:hypothetical protein
MFSHFLMDMVEHGLLSNSYMENKTVMKYCWLVAFSEV